MQNPAPKTIYPLEAVRRARNSNLRNNISNNHRSQRRHYNSGYHGYSSTQEPFSVMNAYWLLFSLNAVSFATWWYARLTDNRPLLMRHATHSLASLAAWDAGRWWTVLTSAFTHHEILHFAFNMFTLRTFCQIVSMVPGIGGLHILAIAFGSSILGSGGWLLQQKGKLDMARQTSPSRWAGGNSFDAVAARAYQSVALGASGVVLGVGAVATCLLPKIPLQLMFIPIGIPLWAITGMYAAIDMFYLNDPKSTTAHAGHLGGLVFGAAYYLAVLRRPSFGVWRSMGRRR